MSITALNVMRAIAAVIILTAISMPSPTYSQAFGVEMGQDVTTIGNYQKIGTNLYSVEVPQPHSEFERYVVRATDSHGVCVVRGIGKDHPNDRFGTSVRKAFRSIESVLENNYGSFLKNDFLRRGALWGDSNEWVMSLRQNERVFQSVWDNEENSTLPENIKSIILQVNATSSSSSWIALQYTYANVDQCDEEQLDLDSSGL